MSDILESSAVITVKKTFNQFAKFYGFCSSAKNAAGAAKNAAGAWCINKLWKSNIKEYNGII